MNYLKGWADKRIAAGDAATEAGKNPRFGDVVDFDPPLAGNHALSGRREVFHLPERGRGLITVGDEEDSWGVKPEDWRRACEERGYLVERGP